MRLDRLGDNGQADARKRQRADAVARMLGHMVTVGDLRRRRSSPRWPCSACRRWWRSRVPGFVGFAIAISGQHLANDVIAGTRALLEDRYAAGDEVVLRIAGTDVQGTVDLIGSASIRLRTLDGATWHAGHASIESVTNLSQLPAVSDIEIPIDAWEQADQRDAIDRLASASNDVGLTGVVFLRDIETHEPDGADSDTVTVRVKSNRPLTIARRGHRPRQAPRFLTRSHVCVAKSALQTAARRKRGSVRARLAVPVSRCRSVVMITRPSRSAALGARSATTNVRCSQRSLPSNLATNGERPWTATLLSITSRSPGSSTTDVWQRSIGVAHRVDDLFGERVDPDGEVGVEHERRLVERARHERHQRAELVRLCPSRKLASTAVR